MILTENQIDEWVRGHAQTAQGVVVELIWRLVSASVPRPKERRFPLGDSIGQHGPDGVLSVELGFEPFVPDGRSFWEIGTGLNPSRKATDDYRDLTGSTPAEVRRESTFIFVTPLSGRRAWKGTWKEGEQLQWQSTREGEGNWKAVKLIDGTRLVDWMRRFPAVEWWLAQIVLGHVNIRGIETAEQRWDLTRSIGEPPPLSPAVFLANREVAGRKLQEVLDNTAVQLKLETRYPDQVVDYVCAYIAGLDSEPRADAWGRTLVVSDEPSLAAVADFREHHIVIADATLDLSGDVGTRSLQRLRRAGHAVVYGGPKGGLPEPASVPLPAPHVHELKNALEESGYPEERARALVHKSAGNLGSLLRCIQNLALLPEWADGSAAAHLAIATLLGAWSEVVDSDKSVAESISGEAYGEWIGAIRDVALRPSTPLIQSDRRWKIVTRYEAWFALGPRLFDEDIDRFRIAASNVLAETDPAFDLPAEQRFAASLHGKTLAHSKHLRMGLAESIALLGSQPNALTSCSHGMAETVALRVVRDLLNGADWLRWASLNDLLPLLAEASPREFLRAVESALAQDPCPFDAVFAEEGNGFTGRNYLTGLLWALETLAWDSDLIVGVTTLLGELAARDPGGNWGNRPANSLTTIFLPWLPQTCASIEKRVGAVQILLREHPAVGWNLLVSLLPQMHTSSSYTRRPTWRELIPDDWTPHVTNREYWEQVETYTRMAVGAAPSSSGRVIDLVKNMEKLIPSARVELLRSLESPAITNLPTSDRFEIWSALTDCISKHVKFSDARWSLPGEVVTELQSIAASLAPVRPSEAHRRLFSERDFDLFESRGNFQQQMALLDQRRRDAVADVRRSEGLDGVIELANSADSPWRVGISFGSIATSEDDSSILPHLLVSNQDGTPGFVGGYARARFHRDGWGWFDGLVTPTWTSNQVAVLLSFLPFEAEAWNRASTFLQQDEAQYWQITPGNAYDSDELERGVDELLKVGRPLAAIRCIQKQYHTDRVLDPKRAVQALLDALNTVESGRSMDSFEIVELIKALQDDPRTERESVYQIEWAYLPLLDDYNNASPRFLNMRLATDAPFFCEVIRIVFRSKFADDAEEQEESAIVGEGEGDAENAAAKQQIATNAYRLLREWRTPPGSGDSGGFNGDALRVWLHAVRAECEASGHLEIAMTFVGHVLTHAPADPDGLWIDRAAAAALNARDATDMRSGFRSELYNSRGAHFVDPSGAPERELAATYQQRAEAVEAAGFHRLATALRELSSSYLREADQVSKDDPFDY